ncbi:MAG: CBS domain-containing protein [Labedaea sp.]
MTAQLTTITVASVMIPNPVTVSPCTPVKDVLELLAEHAIGALPVVSATGLVVGVVSEADLLPRGRKRRDRGTRRYTAGELMTSPAVTVRSETKLAAAVRTLARSGLRQLLVVDDGRLVGVLARRDVLSGYLRPDKEIGADVERELLGRQHPVRVRVDGGIVQLTGRLPEPGDIEAVLGRIAQIPGVIDIRDRLLRT